MFYHWKLLHKVFEFGLSETQAVASIKIGQSDIYSFNCL